MAERRALFLRSVFNRLADLPHPPDQQLQEAIDFVLGCYVDFPWRCKNG
jgi:hypothetical protein